jgi:hypothetical protein
MKTVELVYKEHWPYPSESSIIEAMKAYADQFKPVWIKPSERLPDRVPNKSYSQVPCLVKKNNEVMILVFNHEHLCWDNEDGDDYNCDINAVTGWILLPE